MNENKTDGGTRRWTDDQVEQMLQRVDVLHVDQLAQAMQLRQDLEPDPERDEAIRQLHQIRNLLAHDVDPVASSSDTRIAVTTVLRYLVQIEASSLGSASARRLRRSTTPTTISEILSRAQRGNAASTTDSWSNESMSRSDSLRAEIARLQSAQATLQKTVAAQENVATTARATLASKRATAAKTKSATTRASALRAAENEEKKVVAAEKKLAETRAKIAANARIQAAKTRSLTSALNSERRTSEQADDKRRREEKTHARELARLSAQTIRYVPVSPPAAEPLRVLYLTSNPEAVERESTAPDGTVVREGTWLRTEAEVRGVQQMLRGSKYRDLVDVAYRPAASTEDLLDAINDVRPHVVHFSGHGWSHGLVMDNGSVNSPESRELNFEMLAELLAATTTPPRLLVLNACETLGGAGLLLPSVPVVIAMSDEITDIAASVFAGQFYAAIASAQSIGVAFRQAKLKMRIGELEEFQLPEVISRDDVDIEELVLVKVV